LEDLDYLPFLTQNRSWEPDYLEEGSVEYSREHSIGVEPFVCKQKYSFQFGNKRAQRALGRSPEEKVKGHSVANNREPQGHNLNNFGRGPFDDVIY